MAATPSLGDKARLSSRSASPATNCELVEYIQKSNRTIRLLQEELHSASQVAIRLSHKYECKRAERDQIAEQLATVFRQNEILQQQLQLLCAFITQQCRQLDAPKAVAAILAEVSKLHTASSKHPDQQPKEAVAGSSQAAGSSPDIIAGQLDTCHRSPRLTPGSTPFVTATAPESAATAKKAVLPRHVTANVRHTTAGNAAAGPVPAASASGAISRGKPPLSAAITQQHTWRAEADTTPRLPDASTSKTSGVLLKGSTSSKDSPESEAPGHHRQTSAAKPAGIGLLLTAVSVPSTSPAAGAVGRRTICRPLAAGAASPQSPPKAQAAGWSSDLGSTAAAAAPFNFGSDAMRLVSAADIPAADSKHTTSSALQQQIQQQPPQQQQAGSIPSSVISSPGMASSDQVSPAASSPLQLQQHWHQSQQQLRKVSSLISLGKNQRSSSGRLSPVVGGVQYLGNDAPMPSARTLTCNSDSTAEASLLTGSTAALHAVKSKHAGLPADVANTVTGSSPKQGEVSPKQGDKCKSDTEDSDTNEDTAGSGSSASNSDTECRSDNNNSSRKIEDQPHSTSTGHCSLVAAAAGSQVQQLALFTTQDPSKGTADMPPRSRHASAQLTTNAASAESSRTGPNKASSKPSGISRGGDLHSSSSRGGNNDAADVGSSRNASKSEQEDHGVASLSGTPGPAFGKQRNLESTQLPSTLDSDSEGSSEGHTSSSDDQHDSSEHEVDDSTHGSASSASVTASDTDSSSAEEQEVGRGEQQELFTPGSGRSQDLQQPTSISGSDTHQGNPTTGQHSAAQSPVHTATGIRDSSPSTRIGPTLAASQLQEQQLSMRSSSSFHSAAASPRSRRSSYSGSLHSACSRSTRVSQSSLGLTASLLEPDNFGLLLEQTSSSHSQYRISIDGAGSQTAQQQQEGGIIDWSRGKQPAISHSMAVAAAAAAAVCSSSEAHGPPITAKLSRCRSAAAAAVTNAASEAAAMAAASATTTAEGSTESSRSDGPSSAHNSNFATARSHGSTGGAAAGPATPAAVGAALTAHDSAFGSFVSEGGSMFGFVGDAFSSLQHAVSSAGNVAAAAAAVMGALPAGAHCAATDGASNHTSSRHSWLKYPTGQRSVFAAASQLHHQQQSVSEHTAQPQQSQAGAGSFGGSPLASSSNGSNGGGHDDASFKISSCRSSQGGRAPVLTRCIAGRARGLSKDDAKHAADEQQRQPPGTNTDEVDQRSTNLQLVNEHQQFSSRGDVNTESGLRPQLQGVAGSTDPLVEPLGGQAVTVQRHLDTAAQPNHPQGGGGFGGLSSGTASSGATGMSQQMLSSTQFAGPGSVHRASIPQTAGGGASPMSAVAGVGFGQPFGVGGQPQPFLLGTPFQLLQPQGVVAQAAAFTFGAAPPTDQQRPPQSASLPVPTFVFGGATVGQQQQTQHSGTADLLTHSAGSSRASSGDGATPCSAEGSDSERPSASKHSARQTNAFDVLASGCDVSDSDDEADGASSWEETSDDE